MTSLQKTRYYILLALNYCFVIYFILITLLNLNFKPGEGMYRYNNYITGKFVNQEIYYKDLIHINNNNHQIYLSDTVEPVTGIHELKLRLVCLRNNSTKGYEFYKIVDFLTGSHVCPICNNKLDDNLISKIKELAFDTDDISFKFIDFFSITKLIVIILMSSFIIFNVITLSIKYNTENTIKFVFGCEYFYLILQSIMFIVTVILTVHF